MNPVRASSAAGTLLLLLSAAGAAADAGKVYRWVDSGGRVHYSDQPAPSANEVKLPTSAAAPRPVAAVDPGRGTDDARSKECQTRKDQLVAYRAASKISETDSLGKVHEYSPEEKQKLLEATAKSVQDLCGPG